jgi:hypothetical protein
MSSSHEGIVTPEKRSKPSLSDTEVPENRVEESAPSLTPSESVPASQNEQQESSTDSASQKEQQQSLTLPIEGRIDTESLKDHTDDKEASRSEELTTKQQGDKDYEDLGLPSNEEQLVRKKQSESMFENQLEDPEIRHKLSTKHGTACSSTQQQQ